MSHRALLSLSAAICMLLVPMLPGPQSSVPVEDSRWLHERISSIAPDGGYPSIAIDPLSQDVYVSYYHSAAQNLMLANRTAPGSGNCGEKDDWQCVIIDEPDNVGLYSSIDVFNNGSTKRIGIAYHDATDTTLKFAQKSVSLAFIQPMAIWPLQVIDPGRTGVAAGKYTSVRYGQSGTPFIAYTEEDGGNGNLRFAYSVGAGGNCGPSNTWRCDTIDSASNVAYVSLGLDADDHPAIAYYDRTTKSLKLALGNQVGGTTCDVGMTTWRCYTIEDTAEDIGRFAALAVSDDPNVPFHIAYYNDTTGQLRYAYSTGLTANCGGGLPFKCIDIEPMDNRTPSATTPSKAGLTIAVDGTSPVIGYASFNYLSTDLKIARPAFSLGFFAGNCGPIQTFLGLEYHTWDCSRLARGSEDQGPGFPGSVMGEYADLALMENGLAVVVYTSRLTDSSDSFLRLARQMLPVYLPLIRR